jgi:hypothetical protein
LQTRLSGAVYWVQVVFALSLERLSQRAYPMLSLTMSAVLLLATSADPDHCGHGKVHEECSACADEGAEVAKQILRLESAGWMARRKAARALRSYDWKSHPEAAEALAETLSNDECGLVRQTAAESLAKMRPCLPSVHEVLARAARCDASLLARHWAKKALKSLVKSCVETCAVCETEGPFEEGDLPPVPRTMTIPGNSWGDPRLRRLVPVPDQPSELSPFISPRSPALPPVDPAQPVLSEPGSVDAPPLETPALPASPGGRSGGH